MAVWVFSDLPEDFDIPRRKGQEIRTNINASNWCRKPAWAATLSPSADGRGVGRL
jgi:hypothetical protein